MKTTAETIATQYRLAHDQMRSLDGLQPSEALDEILKYLLVKSESERTGEPLSRDDPAHDLRNRFRNILKCHYNYASEFFHSKDFRLSDECLCRVHGILGEKNLFDCTLDVRSAALRSFLSADLRKGLGIFLTPDEVVSEISEFFRLSGGERILDPACGSGTFLLSFASKSIREQMQIDLLGIDKSPRMMLLADLNFGMDSKVKFHNRVADSLQTKTYEDFAPDESVDIIVTNPPFGVSVDKRSHDLSSFVTVRKDTGKIVRKQSSELLFLERCLSLLKPDGVLAIILPRSVINTTTADYAREKLRHIGALRAVLALPPETFTATGTMTNTVVLFIQKFGKCLRKGDHISPFLARISNVGFDGTGRFKNGNELPGIGNALRIACDSGGTDFRIERCTEMQACETLMRLPDIMRGARKRPSRSDKTLRDFVTLAKTGATPPRKTYTDQGLFLVKVGNLSGAGINWIPRDRNFINPDSSSPKYTDPNRQLKQGDIVLTSSAHSPKYIAKKIDIVSEIPEWVGGSASFVGEVMLLRPNTEHVDPFHLLAYLRLPNIVEEIQNMIRGQTAHLYPDDVLSMQVDTDVFQDSLVAVDMVQSIREESNNSDLANAIAWRQIKLAQRVLDESCRSHLVA